MTDAACVVADEQSDHEIDDEADAESSTGLEADGEHEYEEEAVDTSHLDDMADGCGCAEVWEHLSEQRGESRTE